MTMRTELAPARAFLKRQFPRGGRVLCAVSGGLDSMCLLDFMLRQAAFSPVVAHFNHGLRGERAERDAQFVRDFCAQRGVPFFSGQGDTRALSAAEGLSVEEAARRLRYEFLRQACAQARCDAILTAHHADDSAETMLLNLLRGTGSAGLSGIPAVRDGVCRPFLTITRAELTAYALQNQVPHVEDETNQTDDAARNVLRHQVLPVLRALNPRAVENMSRAAAILEGENRALELLAAQEAAKAVETPRGLSLPCGVLTQLPEALAERTVLLVLSRAAGKRRDLAHVHVEAVLRLARGGSTDAAVSLPYGLTARRGRYTLYVEHLTPPEEVLLRVGQTVRFGGWLVRAEARGTGAARNAGSSGLTAALRVPAETTLRVTPWRGGDRMTLPGSRGARTLKRLCLDHGISSPVRDAMPVVRVGADAAAAPFLGTDEKFAARAKEEAVLVTFILIKETEENKHEK
ncbi:tRNA lysidine(34) synthetase TilS [Oscillibacter sp.]|uniref:tRNA lysidine(34) synthetase TilS n=1 Tax=Oscillibacter sp. TaxID=1945593 RepID=UPI00260EFE1E|nr:tRNA lysidine(34) synthetase TilS [Oscillibacter sp.]MDD3346549.1 tRNA lysidine(34) synthetase TilS [Oscillibacter sp.]